MTTANYDSQTGQYTGLDGVVLEGVEPPDAATVRGIKKAARVSIESGTLLLKRLKEPKFAAEVGMFYGRWNNLKAAVGAGNERARFLQGEIKSFAALQPRIHGFRAWRMAKEIEDAAGIAQSPEALAALIQGVLTASYNAAEMEVPPPEFGDEDAAAMDFLDSMSSGDMEALRNKWGAR
jgi:hypothetical protein